MLEERRFDSSSGKLLYHYCSAATFAAIARSGKIRFSDINMMDDEGEIRWAYSIFELAATELINSEGDNDPQSTEAYKFVEQIDRLISKSQYRHHPVIACFSEDGDSLSQWRQYADGARGFAIGFDANCLSNLPATLLKVEYDQKGQVTEMLSALTAMYYKYNREGKLYRDFSIDCGLLAHIMVAFKNPTFRDEKEVRSIHLIDVEHRNGSKRLVDRGGKIYGNKRVPGQKVDFDLRKGAFVAHIDIPVRLTAGSPAIKEVVLGSGNPSAVGNVKYFLANLNLDHIDVSKSSSTYRP